MFLNVCINEKNIDLIFKCDQERNILKRNKLEAD